MIHVSREAADPVRGGVVRKDGLTGRVEDVDDAIDSLDNIAIANAHALVRGLDRELVSTARIALLVVVQALEAKIEGRIRLGLLAAVHRDAFADALREAAVDNEWRNRSGAAILRVSLPGEFDLDAATIGRRKIAGLRRRRATEGDFAGVKSAALSGHRADRSCHRGGRHDRKRQAGTEKRPAKSETPIRQDRF